MMVAGGSKEEFRIFFLVSGDPETAVALLMTVASTSITVCVCVTVSACVYVSEMAKCMGQERNLKQPFSPKLASGCCQPLVIPPCWPVHLISYFLC